MQKHAVKLEPGLHMPQACMHALAHVDANARMLASCVLVSAWSVLGPQPVHAYV